MGQVVRMEHDRPRYRGKLTSSIHSGYIYTVYAMPTCALCENKLTYDLCENNIQKSLSDLAVVVEVRGPLKGCSSPMGKEGNQYRR